MSKQEMEIIIDQDGNVKVSVNGAEGKQCLDVSQFLEEAIGDVKDRTYKDEYYRQSNTQSGQQQNRQY